MPKVSSNQTSAVIRWDYEDLIRGQLPYDGQTFGQPGFLVAENVDPRRFPGLLTPSARVTTPTYPGTYFNDHVDGHFTCAARSGSRVYFGDDGGNVHRMLSNTFTDGTNGYPYTAGTTVKDMTIAEDGGTSYLFVLWHSAAGDIGRYQVNSATKDNTYWSSTLSGATLTTDVTCLHQAGDSIYIGDGNKIHAINIGSSTTAIDTVFQLPDGYKVKSMTSNENFLIMSANLDGTTKCEVFHWPFTGNQAFRYHVPANEVGATFIKNGVPGVFVHGGINQYHYESRSGVCMFNGSEYQLVSSFGYSTITDPPRHAGADYSTDVVYFNLEGSLYMFGMPGDPSNFRVYNLVKDANGNGLNCFAKILNDEYLWTGTTDSTEAETVFRLNSQGIRATDMIGSRAQLPSSGESLARLDFVKLIWGKTKYDVADSQAHQVSIIYGDETEVEVYNEVKTNDTRVDILRRDTSGQYLSAYTDNAWSVRIQNTQNTTGNFSVLAAVELHFTYEK